MTQILYLWRLLRKVPPEVVEGVVDVVRAIVGGADRETVQRRVEEAIRRRAFDRAMRKLKADS